MEKSKISQNKISVGLNSPYYSSRNSGIAGWGLFEVVISMGLIGFVLSVLLYFQAQHNRFIQEAYWKMIAVSRLDAFFERLLANSTEQNKRIAFSRWNAINKLLLPGGVGSYQCKSYGNDCIVTIHWHVYTSQSMAMERFV